MQPRDPRRLDRLVSWLTHHLGRDIQVEGVRERARQLFPDASAQELRSAYRRARSALGEAALLTMLPGDRPIREALSPEEAGRPLVSVTVVIEVGDENGVLQWRTVEVDISPDAPRSQLEEEALRVLQEESPIVGARIEQLIVVPPVLEGGA